MPHAIPTRCAHHDQSRAYRVQPAAALPEPRSQAFVTSLASRRRAHAAVASSSPLCVAQERVSAPNVVSLDGSGGYSTPSHAVIHRRAAEGGRAQPDLGVPRRPSPPLTLVTGLYQSSTRASSTNKVDSRGPLLAGDRDAVADGRWWGGETIWVPRSARGCDPLPASGSYEAGSAACADLLDAVRRRMDGTAGTKVPSGSTATR